MNSPIFPFPETYWYQSKKEIIRLEHDIAVDLVIVGGGMAGLSAAQAAVKKGLNVALIEKTFCGAGASGKSSGFITPDAEFSFSDLVAMHGPEQALKLWSFICSGVENIRSTIKTHALDCQYYEQDTLVLATSQRAFNKRITHEHETRLKYGLESNLHSQQAIQTIIQSNGYHGGVSYGKTFSIKTFDYCQGLKKILQSQGVKIFEETAAEKIVLTGIKTKNGIIEAQKIIIATDHFLPELAPFEYDLYHVQTFLMASAPLNAEKAKKLFPSGPMMAWDTDLIYHYFRLTKDNRLLLGGADLFSTYSKNANHHNSRVFKNLTWYAKNYFPELSLEWEYIWPGLIGITKDIFPFAGKDKNNKNLFYIAGAAGLPWAAALGLYAVDSLYDKPEELDIFFNPYRRYLVPHSIQAI
ncbi:MAG: FAD-binding oxidoreductase, partial [Candidatus Babeliaceae bacterium]|nr:FAD-binding oxidoreductase [Candidatus Babeliaceae bacterium]